MPRQRDSSFNIGVFNMLKLLQLKSNEMLIYNVLCRKPMTIAQLRKNTKMSERSLRTHLDDMLRRSFVRRKLVEGKHLKYLYYANSGDNVLAAIKRNIEDIEKMRLRTKEEIIRGSREALEKNNK